MIAFFEGDDRVNGSKRGWSTDPEDDGLPGPRVLKPVFLFSREVETFPPFELLHFLPETEIDPPLEDQSELLPLVGLLRRARLPFAKSEEDGLETPVGRSRNEKLESLNLLLLDGDPVRLPVDDLLFRCFPEEVGDILVQGIQDLDQAVQGNGGQVMFDLGDEPLGQIGPLRQFFLGQIAELAQTPDPFPDLDHDSPRRL